MKPGSVVVDLAAESGGNVEGSVAGRGRPDRQRPGLGRRATCRRRCPGRRRRLYAQNVVNLLTLMTSTPTGDGFAPDFDDEIVAGSCVTHDGAIRHEPTRDGPGRRRLHERARRLADDLRAQRLRRHRGDLQGLLDAAHAADVRRQRDPRRHPARRDPGHRHDRQRPWRSSSGWSRSCSPRSTWSAASWSPTGCCRCSRARSRRRPADDGRGSDA